MQWILLVKGLKALLAILDLLREGSFNHVHTYSTCPQQKHGAVASMRKSESQNHCHEG